MKRARLCVSVLALALTCVSLSIGSTQKITVDPNTSVAASYDTTHADADIRLAQKITYEARHKSIKGILTDLSEQSSVVLSAGYNTQDWQVRDRKMIIFARDISLAELMNSIARVMKFKWSKNDQVSPPTYRLIADRRLIARMQADQQLKGKELKAEVTRRRHSLVDAIAEVNKMSDSEIEALAQENPYLYQIAKTGCTKLTQALFDEVPGLMENFLNSSRNIVLSPSQLSPGTRQLLLDAIKGNWPYRQFQVGGNKPFPDGLESVLDSSDLGMEHLPRPFQGGDGSDQLAFYGGLGVGTPLGFCHIGYWRDPDSPMSQWQAQELIDGAAGKEFNGVLPGQPPIEEIAMMERKNFEQYSLIEPRTEHVDEPYLHTMIKLKASKPLEQTENGGNRARPQVLAHVDCLQLLAEATSFSVISDSFNRVYPGSGLGEGDKELQDILKSLAEAYDYNWEKHGSVFEFHDRDWFRKRSSQIPDDWIDTWASVLENNGILSLDEFAEVCALDFDQIEENISGDPVLDSCVSPIWNLINNKVLLCLYLRMNNYQQKMLFSEDGLNSRTLTPDLYQHMIGVFDNRNALKRDVERFLGGVERGLTLKAAAVSGEDGTLKGYQFTATTDDGQPPFKWDVTMPTYKARVKVMNRVNQ